jgi:hypothetical protein
VRRLREEHADAFDVEQEEEEEEEEARRGFIYIRGFFERRES